MAQHHQTQCLQAETINKGASANLLSEDLAETKMIGQIKHYVRKRYDTTYEVVMETKEVKETTPRLTIWCVDKSLDRYSEFSDDEFDPYIVSPEGELKEFSDVLLDWYLHGYPNECPCRARGRYYNLNIITEKWNIRGCPVCKGYPKIIRPSFCL